MESKEPQHTNPQGLGKKKSKLAKWLRWFLFLLVFIPVLLTLLIQLPVVQNLLIDTVTSRLSKKMNAEVSIDHIDFSVFHGLELNDVLLVDERKDTLIQSEVFSVSLTKNLFSYFQNEINLDGLVLQNTQLNIKRYGDESKNNLALILDKFETNQQKENNDPLSLYLNTVNLDGVEFTYDDYLQGQFYDLIIPSGRIGIEQLDSLINLNKIEFRNPTISIRKTLGSDIELVADSSIQDTLEAVIETENQKQFSFSIDKVDIFQARFRYVDEGKNKLNNKDVNHFNPHDFDVDQFEFHLQDLDISNNILECQINQVSFIDSKGFVLQQVKAEKLMIAPRKISLENFIVKTENSEIKDHIELKFRSYDSFEDFTNKVILQVDLASSKISNRDLAYFIPSLTRSKLFSQNSKDDVRIQGKLRGRINNLSGNDISIAIGNRTSFKGNFSTRNITNPDRALINLTVNEIKTDLYDLQKIIPGFNPPENFFKLGNIRFEGRFDGFINDFVSLGNLKSDIGSAKLDMRLDLKDGRNNANYSGELELKSFDLATWSEDQNFGLVDFSATVAEGQGLTLENASADLDALIDNIQYRGYDYKNLYLDGRIDKNRFLGDLIVEDPDLDFEFHGDIQLIDGVPKLDFDADIRHINLQQLNLSPDITGLTGKVIINAAGEGLADFKGDSYITDFKLTKNDTLYTLDSVYVSSYLVDDDNRKVEAYTDFAKISMKGKFNLNTLVNDAKRVVKKNFPYYAKDVRLNDQIQNNQDFVFKISMNKPTNFYNLIGLNQFDFENLEFFGELDNYSNTVSLHADIPSLKLNNVALNNGILDFATMDAQGSINLVTDTSSIGSFIVNPVQLSTTINGDSLDFRLATDNLVDSLQRIDIGGVMSPHPSGFKVNIYDNEWLMFGDKWEISKNNSIVFGNQSIDINNLQWTDGFRFISIKDINQQGVYLSVNNFDFLKISGIIDYDKMKFEGAGDLELQVSNIFEDPDIELALAVPEFSINGDAYGSLTADVIRKRDQPAIISLLLGDDKFQVGVDGNYDFDKDILDGNLSAQDLPLNFMEYIIDTGISSTHGTIDVNVVLSGSAGDPKFNGTALFKDCGSTIDYTGMHYTFDDQLMKVSDTYLDLSGGVLEDPEGNKGYILGGLKHSFLQDFRMFVDMYSDDIIVLNTTREDNPLYYGFGKGKFDVSFRGPFSKADMVINATTGPRTVLSMPVDYYYTGYETSFIEFINKDNQEELEQEFKIEGLDIDMNISLTSDAEMNIIFDESRSDVIKGRGEGDIQVSIPRSGDFTVYGDYVISSGEYLFTVYELVNKPFEVRPGSTIQWTGDPINANLKVQADYGGRRTNLSVFLAEYLTPQDPVYNEARRNYDVNLTLDLTGTLYEPKINFDLSFPNLLPGPLRSYTESKLRTLRANQNLLNDQVVGMYMWGTFLPNNNPLGGAVLSGSNITQLGSNTLSEYFSQQFSQILSGLVNAALPENEFISSVDLDIGLSQNVDLLGQVNTGLIDVIDPDEIQLVLNPKFKFWDERFSAKVGGNYVNNSTSNQIIPSNTFIPDLSVAYDLTEDGRLKLKLSYIYDFDQTSGTARRRQRYGLGLNFRQEFGKVVQHKELNKLQKAIEESVEEALELLQE